MTVEEKLQEAREFLSSEIMEIAEDILYELINDPSSEDSIVEVLRNDIDVLQIPYDIAYDSPDAYVSIEKINPFDYANSIIINVLKEIVIDNQTCQLTVQTKIEPEEE